MLALADPDPGVGEEFIGRQGKVARRRARPDTAGGVVDVSDKATRAQYDPAVKAAPTAATDPVAT